VTHIDQLADQFEQTRGHLRAVAYRMLGSLNEAEDAVQEAWLRLSRTDTSAVENLRGWLTTVVARVCLDMLRSRKSRREESMDAPERPPIASTRGPDPEHEALLADSVGLALLVVLETLDPPERLAFVLHDMFAVPFDEIATIVGRTPMAARQLASRARRRVQGASMVRDADLARQREVVEAFLAASRAGDFEALLALLDPNVVLRPDRIAAQHDRGADTPPREAREVRGAEIVARGAVRRRARWAQAALVNGAAGIVVAPYGRLLLVLRFTLERGRIVGIDVIGEPERLRELDLALFEEPRAH
jgi:RNA polymerase sigma factor (sigma-70 family)